MIIFDVPGGDVISYRERLKAVGMTDMQINAIMNTFAREVPDEECVRAYPADTKEKPEVKEKKVYTDEDITSVSDLKRYSAGSIVELPSFGDGQPFIVRLRRPSLLVMSKNGQIPNSLINQASSLFTKGMSSVSGSKGGSTIGELYDIIEVICKSALVKPTYDEIKEAGLTLTDDQMMAIFSYSQNGISALESFR